MGSRLTSHCGWNKLRFVLIKNHAVCVCLGVKEGMQQIDKVSLWDREINHGNIRIYICTCIHCVCSSEYRYSSTAPLCQEGHRSNGVCEQSNWTRIRWYQATQNTHSQQRQQRPECQVCACELGTSSSLLFPLRRSSGSKLFWAPSPCILSVLSKFTNCLPFNSIGSWDFVRKPQRSIVDDRMWWCDTKDPPQDINLCSHHQKLFAERQACGRNIGTNIMAATNHFLLGFKVYSTRRNTCLILLI